MSAEEKIKTTSGILDSFEAEPTEVDETESEDLTLPKEDQMLIKLDGVSINAIPRADGRYQGYISRYGVKKYYYGRTYDEVEAKINYALQEESEPQRTLVYNRSYGYKRMRVPLFGTYVENWLITYKKPNLKPTSFISLQGSLKIPLELFGKKPLDMISANDLQRMFNGISAPRTRDLCKINLSQIFKKAIAEGLISRNPCDLVEFKKHKQQHKNALTKEEQEKFLQAAKTTAHYLLFRFLLATGLRIGEALALTKDDVNEADCSVTVNKNVVFIKGERLVQTTPKSEAGNRTIPFPRELLPEIMGIDTFELFPCSYNAVKKTTQRISQETGISVSPHILRHTYATRLEEAGISPKLKQYLLGHASLEMTQNVYTDMQIEHVKSMADSIRNAV